MLRAGLDPAAMLVRPKTGVSLRTTPPARSRTLKIVSFLRNDALCTGALLPGDLVLDFTHPAAGLPSADGPLEWCDLDGAPHQAARRLVDAVESRTDELAASGAIVPMGSVTLEAPVPRPGKVICIGLNYRDHAEESGMDIPELPLVFSKFSSCVVGPEAKVVLPPGAKEVDYEAEFGVVIGRTASRVKAEDAMDHVLGYCNVNDVSARDFQFADGQWQRGKSCETFCPAGPFLATADDGVAQDSQALDLDFHHVTVAEIDRRLTGETDAGWGAGGDDVAGHEGDGLREEGDDFGDVEDELVGVGVLLGLAVEVEADPEIVRVGDLVFGGDVLADGGEGVAGLAALPLAVELLEVAGGDVVEVRVAGHV